MATLTTPSGRPLNYNPANLHGKATYMASMVASRVAYSTPEAGDLIQTYKMVDLAAQSAYMAGLAMRERKSERALKHYTETKDQEFKNAMVHSGVHNKENGKLKMETRISPGNARDIHSDATSYLKNCGILSQNPTQRAKEIKQLCRYSDGELERMLRNKIPLRVGGREIHLTKEDIAVIRAYRDSDRYLKNHRALKNQKRKVRHKAMHLAMSCRAPGFSELNQMMGTVRMFTNTGKALRSLVRAGLKSGKVVVIAGYRLTGKIVVRPVYNQLDKRFHITSRIQATDTYKIINSTKNDITSVVNKGKGIVNRAKNGRRGLVNHGLNWRRRFNRKVYRHARAYLWRTNPALYRLQHRLRMTIRNIRSFPSMIKNKIKDIIKSYIRQIVASIASALSGLFTFLTPILLIPIICVVLFSMSVSIISPFVKITSQIADWIYDFNTSDAKTEEQKVSTRITGLANGKVDQKDLISLSDIYDFIKEVEENKIQDAVTEAQEDAEQVEVKYKSMNKRGAWVDAESSNNLRQIVTMAYVVFQDQTVDGGFDKDTLEKYKEYCEALVEESITIETSSSKTHYCTTEDELSICTHLDKNGNCKGHKSCQVLVKIHGYPYSLDEKHMADAYKKIQENYTLFDIDNSYEGYYEYLSDTTKKALKKRAGKEKSTKQMAEDKEQTSEKAESDEVLQTIKGFGLTTYSQKNDECSDPYTEKLKSASGRQLECNPTGGTTNPGDEGGVVSVAVDPNAFGLTKNDIIKQKIYFTMDGFGDTIFRIDDIGGGVKGKHIDIFTYDYTKAVKMGPSTIKGGGCKYGFKTEKATIHILTKSGIKKLRYLGASGNFWNEETEARCLQICAQDWGELYGIKEENFHVDISSAEEMIAAAKSKVNKLFSSTKTLNTTKVNHYVGKRETQEGYSIKYKKYSDTYVNKIQYTLLKWALSRDGTSVYSQANRAMKKNPSATASTDCSGFVSWVLAKTKTELNLTARECLAWNYFKNLGFSGESMKAVYTTSEYKDWANGSWGIKKTSDLLPGDILVRGTDNSYGNVAAGKNKTPNHVAIFVGFTDKGYQYIDCTGHGGEAAIQLTTRATKKVISDNKKGHQPSGDWGGAIRLFDYDKLNSVTVTGQTEAETDYLFTTPLVLKKLGKIEVDYEPFKKKNVIDGESHFPWRKYKKYGGKTRKWKISLS